MFKPAVAIVGAGKVGTALAAVLHSTGCRICGVASRSLSSAQKLADLLGAQAAKEAQQVTFTAEVIFITTPDDYIAETVLNLQQAGGFRAGQLVYHTSGALGDKVLLPAKESGAYIGCIHPLQTLAGTIEDQELLANCFFAVAGDQEATAAAEKLIRLIGGTSLTIPDSSRALYHAAACMASNYLVALMHAAAKMLTRVGIPPEESIQVVMPLVLGTLTNIANKGTLAALTGPISRGDVKTVEKHFNSLIDAKELAMYAELAKYTVGIAKEKGTLSEKQAEEILCLAENKA